MATKKQLEPVAPAADKKKALAAALGQIEKQFGKGSVMRLGENTGMNIEHIPTGSIGLDLALGIGGLPRGRIIEVYGPESSGKTTVALHSRCQTPRSRAARLPLSTPSTRSIPVYAQAHLAWTLTACWSPSPTPVSRRLEICRSAGALGRDRHRGYRLRCRAGAARRNRRRDGRLALSACRRD